MRKRFFIALLTLSSWGAFSQSSKLSPFPLSSVRLLPSPFLEAQQTDAKYILSLDADRLLAPFLREAGLEPKAKSYGNWENTGLDGHIGGHYLTAVAQMYASTGDKVFLDRLNYMLDWLEKCQQQNGNGYVGGVPGSKAMWNDIAQGKIKAGGFSLNDKWVPWYNIHKTYAGLVDAYRLTGSEKAKKILIGLSEWALNLTAKLTEGQMQDMLRSEHGGMNEVFADVALITGDKRYLELAKKFSHQTILNPLAENKDSLNGLHANTQIPKVIGFARIAAQTGDKSYGQAASFFWNTVVNNRTVAFGGNSVREHFNPPNNFSSMLESREGPETCNSYNMLKLSKQLFLENPDSKYFDYYERTVYNHILSSQHPEGGFVYFTPIRPNHYRVYSSPQQSFWCCVGSGIENHGKYGEMIYANDEKNLYVNLFIPSTLTWKERGIAVNQQTTFPQEERSTFTMSLKKSQRFSLKLRQPSWLAGPMLVKVNNQEVSGKVDPAGYLSLDRTWKNGDKIAVTLPMKTMVEQLPDKSNWLSFVHGPLVLAATTGTNDLTKLRADDSRMGHIASGKIIPLEEAPLLVGNKEAFVAAIKPAGNGLSFSASELIHQDRYKDLKLVPFYQVHDARYVIYWPFTSREELPKVLQSMKQKEEAKLALEANTVDLVIAGEQQPESDHNFKGEHTETGMFREQHYRNGKGWFSYDMRNPDSQASKLSITYFGADRNKDFDIYVNDALLSSISLKGDEGNDFVTKTFDLPAAIVRGNKNPIKVQFKAKAGSAIAGIYEVRLLRK
ncbi:glycoside hydrolase family 127 protein [Pedobacter sp. SYSU D00535]|uniref:glycoside hydrolase family 127 protein n=1 Tax=Pedobacter sp. SYSU D00535 TaxID=2810308 RepID=UPI001A96E5BD|nr:glycoside hydrolase family 127 protein [Pedobacter sp. SYSU D00535]